MTETNPIRDAWFAARNYADMTATQLVGECVSLGRHMAARQLLSNKYGTQPEDDRLYALLAEELHDLAIQRIKTST